MLRSLQYDHSALEEYTRDSPELQRRLAQLKEYSQSKRKPIATDQSSLTSLFSKAKSYTSKQRAKMVAAKYQHFRRRDDEQQDSGDDDIRLLSLNATAGDSDNETSSRQTRPVFNGRSTSKRGIFDDI